MNKSALLPGGSTRRWRKIRIRILRRDGYRCAICGKRANHVDHIRLRSQNGGDHPNNLRVLCKKCNLSRERQ